MTRFIVDTRGLKATISAIAIVVFAFFVLFEGALALDALNKISREAAFLVVTLPLCVLLVLVTRSLILLR